MASVTLKVGTRFPAGTSVEAYRRWMFAKMPSGPPQGTVVASSTVQSDSTVFLTGLDADEQYTAHGLVDGEHRYVNFSTEPVSTTGGAGSPEGKTISGVGAPTDGIGEDGQWYIDTSASRLYGPKAAGAWPGGYITLGGSTSPDAAGDTKGILKLAGALAGTADSPTVPGLTGKADVGHQHVFADVANLQTTLDGKAAVDDLLLPFARQGALSVAAGTARWKFPYDITIVSVQINAGTAPTGASLIVDVNRSGTTIFTTQANRPTISASGFSSSVATPDVTSVTTSQYLTVDVDQIGSTVAGSDLTGVIRYRKA